MPLIRGHRNGQGSIGQATYQVLSGSRATAGVKKALKHSPSGHGMLRELEQARRAKAKESLDQSVSDPTRPASSTISLNLSRNQPVDRHAQDPTGAVAKQLWLNGSCVRMETYRQGHPAYSGGSPKLQPQLRAQPHRHPVRKRYQHSPTLNSWTGKPLHQYPQRQQYPGTKKQPQPPPPTGHPPGSNQDRTATRKTHRIAKPMDLTVWATTS